jgi:hypothetical protein
MSAAKTLIAMTSEGYSAATDDSVHDLAMLPGQCEPCRSQKLLPDARMISATSRVATGGNTWQTPPPHERAVFEE